MQFSVRSLRARYPVQERWAVDDVSLDIAPGYVTWISGALGSGSSTLLLALAGLMPRLTGGEKTGTITTDGSDVASSSPLNLGIGYLGPSPALQLSGIARTVRDEVAVGPMNLGRTRNECIAAAEDAMQKLHVVSLSERAPNALSGGETQRVLLAAVMASNPRAWLLDEPFSALDHAGTANVQALLRSLARAGRTIVVACDDADVMADVADRLIVMREGRVVLDGVPADLLAGDAIVAAGAGSTDAATLALAAGVPAPRPITRAQLLAPLVPCPGARPIPAASPVAGVRPTVEFAKVAFRYPGGPQILQDVTLQVVAGQGVGLFGHNGAGKSTLLRLAMALERPESGTIDTLGVRTNDRHPEDLAPQAGYLFQQPERQLFASSVRSECSLAPRLAGWDQGRIDEAVTEVLNELGLSETSGEHPYDLPLPRRRLVALAAILSADPDLILLDEPTAALDAASRDRVIGAVRERIRRGKSVIAITHDAGFAHEALDRGLLIDGGRVAFDGPVRDIIDDRRMIRPAALAAALVLGLPPGEDRRENIAAMLRRN